MVNSRKQYLKKLLVFATTYTATNLSIIIYNNTIILWRFCGSPRDFTDGVAPEVCLSLPAYTLRVIQHEPYILLALTTSTAATTLIYHYREKITKQIETLKTENRW